MRSAAYAKNSIRNEKPTASLILNTRKPLPLLLTVCSERRRTNRTCSSALKNQMVLVQTLSDNNQSKLESNEQQIDEVIRRRCIELIRVVLFQYRTEVETLRRQLITQQQVSRCQRRRLIRGCRLGISTGDERAERNARLASTSLR